MSLKYDLDSSTLLLNQAFRNNKTHLEYINNYIKSVLDTEDFSMFSKYTKNIIISYFKAFLNRLVSQIWKSFAVTESKPDQFFGQLSSQIGRQLNRAKKNLLSNNKITDTMSERMMCSELDKFFKEYEDRAEFTKAQNDYLSVKQRFSNIHDLMAALHSCGEEMVENAEYLLSTYIKYKAAILKGMGYDIVLEYYSIDNFNFIYRDPRLQDATFKEEVEHLAMNAALKATMPGFNGDISVFEHMLEDLKG